ncbi:MAG: hypothetical protein WBW62_05055, partial [Solirubrobacterales bacterium]
MIEDIYRPLPDNARKNIEGLRQPVPNASSDLPDWARTLITHHTVLDVGVAELESLGLTNREAFEGRISIAYEGLRIDFLPGGKATAARANPETPPEDEWMHPRITDYWETQTGAIEAAGRQLKSLDEEAITAALSHIVASIERHVGVLNDEYLVSASISFVDDLYKAASSTSEWDESIRVYLNASAGTFARLLSFRGIQIQSLVDNQWDDPARLIQLFPDWFRASGIVFISPQVLVRNLAERDGVESGTGPGADIAGLESRYIDEA